MSSFALYMYEQIRIEDTLQLLILYALYFLLIRKTLASIEEQCVVYKEITRAESECRQNARLTCGVFIGSVAALTGALVVHSQIEILVSHSRFRSSSGAMIRGMQFVAHVNIQLSMY